jgi:F0F1-type ATP synthase assembly protein I
MSLQMKRATVALLGGAGFIAVVVGALTDIYATTTGVIILLVCGMLSGVLARYWRLPEEREYERTDSFT